MEEASPVVTPVAKRPKSEELLLLAGSKPLNAEDTTLFSFAAGSVARGMTSPTTKDFEELKRVGRCLGGPPVGATVFEPQTLPGVLVFCDADHAGDLGTRTLSSGQSE